MTSKPNPPLLKRPRKPWTALRRLIASLHLTPTPYGTDLRLEDLVGTHVLTGFESDPGTGSTPQRILFTLDGRTFVAVENPDDGYRSMLDHLRLSPKAAPKVGPRRGVKVVATMGTGALERVLILSHAKTGALIMEMGTYDAYDYYPAFHWEWHPEHLSGKPVIGAAGQPPQA